MQTCRKDGNPKMRKAIARIGFVCVLSLLGIASTCDDNSGGVTPIKAPDFDVTSVNLAGPPQITNHTSSAYTVTVTIARHPGNVGPISGTVRLTGSNGPFHGDFGTQTLTFPALTPPATTSPPLTANFTLFCADPIPPGPGNTLRSNTLDSHHGGRVVNACTGPPGCGGPHTPCKLPLGCPYTVDDKVTVEAVFTDLFRGTTSASIPDGVLCVP